MHSEQFFKMAASRFVDVSEEEINLMVENAENCAKCNKGSIEIPVKISFMSICMIKSKQLLNFRNALFI